MFDIGFQELLLVGIIGLVVIGPERLPGVIRTCALWIGRIRRSFNEIKSDIEREVGADDIRRQLHNEAIMKSLGESGQELQESLRETADTINQPPLGQKPEQSRHE